MPEITPDLSDKSRCVSVHWSLPVQCVLPGTHRENFHEAWHPQTGNRMRYRRSMGVFISEDLHDGAWHDLRIPAPGVVCGEPHSSSPGVFCQMEHGEDGNRWNHFAIVYGCRYTWHTPHPRKPTVEQLASDVTAMRARVVVLEAALAAAGSSLSSFIFDSDDPGVNALGAQWLYHQAMPKADDPFAQPRAFRTSVFEEAARAAEGLDKVTDHDHRKHPQAYLDGYSDGVQDVAEHLEKLADQAAQGATR